MSDFKAKMHQIRFRLGLQRSPKPIAGCKKPTSKGKEGEGRVKEGMGGEGMEREGEGRGGRERGKGKWRGIRTPLRIGLVTGLLHYGSMKPAQRLTFPLLLSTVL